MTRKTLSKRYSKELVRHIESKELIRHTEMVTDKLTNKKTGLDTWIIPKPFVCEKHGDVKAEIFFGTINRHPVYIYKLSDGKKVLAVNCGKTDEGGNQTGDLLTMEEASLTLLEKIDEHFGEEMVYKLFPTLAPSTTAQ